MRTTFLTRSDEGVGAGVYDSIAWAFEVHLKEPDDPAIKSAILYGNEDAPEKIEFFDAENPEHYATPYKTWEPTAD
jgi:hypothetical protein